MKKLSYDEQLALLRYHGGELNMAMVGGARTKSDLLAHAEKAVALIKAMPKLNFAPEQ